MISVVSPVFTPARTWRTWKYLGDPSLRKFLSRTKTNEQSPSQWTASLGTTNDLRLFPQDDPAGAKGVGPQPSVGVGKIDAHLDGPRLTVGRGADPAHFALDFGLAAIVAGAEQHRLPEPTYLASSCRTSSISHMLLTSATSNRVVVVSTTSPGTTSRLNDQSVQRERAVETDSTWSTATSRLETTSAGSPSNWISLAISSVGSELISSLGAGQPEIDQRLLSR